MESRPFTVIIICGLVSMLLAGLIAVHCRASEGQDSDVLVRVFGGTAEIASNSAMDQADLYLHAGTGHACPADGRSHGKDYACSLPLHGVVTKLQDETAPKEHKHIQGVEEKELLPWFAIAARLNPHNVEAWLDGTYWYYRTGQVREAERFITKGIEQNPKDHRVHLERGILYHRMKRWEAAAQDLKNSIDLYKKLSDESPFELKAARVYLRDCRQRLSNQ